MRILKTTYRLFLFLAAVLFVKPGLSQTDLNPCDFNFSGPTILLSNGRYEFYLTHQDTSKHIFVSGKGFSINRKGEMYEVWVKTDDDYYLDISLIENGDTTLLNRKYYDVIQQGTPRIEWGNDFTENDTIRIPSRRVYELKTIKAASPWVYAHQKYWTIHNINFHLPNYNSPLAYDALTDDMIKELLKLTQPTRIQFHITYSGPDQIRRLFRFERVFVIE